MIGSHRRRSIYILCLALFVIICLIGLPMTTQQVYQKLVRSAPSRMDKIREDSKIEKFERLLSSCLVVLKNSHKDASRIRINQAVISIKHLLAEPTFIIPSSTWVITLPKASHSHIPPTRKISVIRALVVLHLNDPKCPNIRQILLYLLRLNVFESEASWKKNHETPLIFQLMLSNSQTRYDTELLEAFFNAGPPITNISASFHQQINGYIPAEKRDKNTNEAVSLLHLIAFPHQTANIMQGFLQEIYDEMRDNPSLSFRDVCVNTTTAISGALMGFDRTRFAALGLLRSSHTLRELEKDWDENVPLVCVVSEKKCQRIIQESAVAIFQLYIASSSSSSSLSASASAISNQMNDNYTETEIIKNIILEFGWKLPQLAGGRGLTVFHICAQKGWGLMVNEFRVFFTQQLHKFKIIQDLIQTAIYQGLISTNDCCGETPLHLASRFTATFYANQLDPQQVDEVLKLLNCLRLLQPNGDIPMESFNSSVCFSQPWHDIVSQFSDNVLIQLIHLVTTMLSPSQVRQILIAKDQNGQTFQNFIENQKNLLEPYKLKSQTKYWETLKIKNLRDKTHRKSMCNAIKQYKNGVPVAMRSNSTPCDLSTCNQECVSKTLETLVQPLYGDTNDHDPGKQVCSVNQDSVHNSDVIVWLPGKNNDTLQSQYIPRSGGSPCEFEEYFGFPTQVSEMIQLLQRNRPIIFRGGAQALKMPLHFLSHKAFESIHRNVSVAITSLENHNPGGVGEWHGTKVEEFSAYKLGEFLARPNCDQVQHVHVRLDKDNQYRVLNSSLPDIVSSTDMYSRNSQLLYGMTQAKDFLRRVPGLNIPQGGLRESGLELGARIFASCAGDGRALHYHEMALNTLVHGQKRWAVLQPNHALFATKMGSLVFTDLDVESFLKRIQREDTRNTTNREDLPTRPLQCIQKEGDMVLIPAFWSHATCGCTLFDVP